VGVFRLLRKFSERLLSDVKRDYEVNGSGFWVMENIGFLDAMFDRDYRRLESDLKDHI
jgi:hypothetical protein